MIILYASAAIRLLINLKDADRIRERLGRSEESLHVSHLFDLEVTQTLRRYVLSGGRHYTHDLPARQRVRFPVSTNEANGWS